MALQKTPDGICWESIGSTTQPVTVDMYSNFDGELHCYQARGWIPKESHGFCHVWTDPDPEKKKKKNVFFFLRRNHTYLPGGGFKYVFLSF